MQSVAKNHRVQLQLLSLKPEQTITITMNDAVLPNAITCFQSIGLKYNPPSLHSPAPCEAETRRLPVQCGVSAKQMLKTNQNTVSEPNQTTQNSTNAMRHGTYIPYAHVAAVVTGTHAQGMTLEWKWCAKRQCCAKRQVIVEKARSKVRCMSDKCDV